MGRQELDTYQKSNILINAKYGATVTENKLFAIALSDQSRMINDNGTIRVTIPSAELKKALAGKNDGSFYQTLKDGANRLMSRKLGIEMDGKFDYINVVQRAQYDEATLTITFATDLENYLVGLKAHYTTLKLSQTLQYDNDYAIRLSEILISKTFDDKYHPDKKIWRLEYDLAELFFLLGIVNGEDPKAKAILNSPNPDYDKAVEAVNPKNKKKSLLDYSKFRTRALEPAIQEINEISDLHVEYEAIRQGVGGRVRKIIFTVTKKEQIQAEQPKTKQPISLDDVLDQAIELMHGEFKIKEIRIICEAAKYDYDLIQQEYELMQETKNVSNPAGWMLKAVQEKYEPSETKNRKSGSGKFGDIETNKYDFEALEKELMNN